MDSLINPTMVVPVPPIKCTTCLEGESILVWRFDRFGFARVRKECSSCGMQLKLMYQAPKKSELPAQCNKCLGSVPFPLKVSDGSGVLKTRVECSWCDTELKPGTDND